MFADERDRRAAEAADVQQHLFTLKREVVRLRRFAMPVRQGLDLIQERPEIGDVVVGSVLP